MGAEHNHLNTLLQPDHDLDDVFAALPYVPLEGQIHLLRMAMRSPVMGPKIVNDPRFTEWLTANKVAILKMAE